MKKYLQNHLKRGEVFFGSVSEEAVHPGREGMAAIVAWSVAVEAYNTVEQAAEYSVWKPKVDTTFRVQPQQPSPASEATAPRFQAPKAGLALPPGDQEFM